MKIGIQSRLSIETYPNIPVWKISLTIQNPRPSDHPRGNWDLGNIGSESVGGKFKAAGHEVGTGAKEAGHEIKDGKPIAAGKELGQGIGRAAKDVGQGVKKAVSPK